MFGLTTKKKARAERQRDLGLLTSCWEAFNGLYTYRQEAPKGGLLDRQFSRHVPLREPLRQRVTREEESLFEPERGMRL